MCYHTIAIKYCISLQVHKRHFYVYLKLDLFINLVFIENMTRMLNTMSKNKMVEIGFYILNLNLINKFFAKLQKMRNKIEKK